MKYFSIFMVFVLFGAGCVTDGRDRRPTPPIEEGVELHTRKDRLETDAEFVDRLASRIDFLGERMHEVIVTDGDVKGEYMGILAFYEAGIDDRDPSSERFVPLFVELETEDAEGYVLHQLPWLVTTYFTTIESVFFRDVDGDGFSEIYVLNSQMTGIGPEGAKPWYETFVVRYWDKLGGFDRHDEIEEFLYDQEEMQTVSEVKNALKNYK